MLLQTRNTMNIILDGGQHTENGVKKVRRLGIPAQLR